VDLVPHPHLSDNSTQEATPCQTTDASPTHR
jgi:hypothetical protein